ncbi:hypothetical protein PPSIR1_34597 [Plesiocystis pacifica SIR-1]|uniref:Uncharacterized protein n=1 Tax=Plesiocystis pacifica SIR-1 TaxID=391625 RepID=A6GKB4_9BACT|nr:hypothetical protein [Plesiocystis pacifica]EDM73693.1 hypothetical protein PPSIR1_34597 [Plesiocystis pacifica SIR-1]
MTAIITLATLTVVTVALAPGLAELARMREEQTNPIRQLRVPTRRSQAEALHPSASFHGA